jgi:hypothetical protein
MATDERTPYVRRESVKIFLAGVGVVVLYVLLRALDVGKIGDPADIGGGLFLLVGYPLTAIGALMIVRDVIRHRSNRR